MNLQYCQQAEQGMLHIAGVDEAGRGPLAGSVVAAAVILNSSEIPDGLRDSKKLTEARREQLAQEIKQAAICYAIGEASVVEIDRINILQASLLAMQRAVSGLSQLPEFIYVDGNRCPDWHYPSRAVTRGDDAIQAIAAASILAKVQRDHDLQRLHQQYPQYGFDRHKGYPTAAHLQALREHGASPVHRHSYAPVREIVNSLK